MLPEYHGCFQSIAAYLSGVIGGIGCNDAIHYFHDDVSRECTYDQTEDSASKTKGNSMLNDPGLLFNEGAQMTA